MSSAASRTRALLFACAIAVLILAPVQCAPPSDDSVGVNLPPVRSTGPFFMFTDLFKHSTPFYPQLTRNSGGTWLWYNPVLLNKTGTRGYPVSIPRTMYYPSEIVVAMADFIVPYADDYVLLYDGAGRLEVVAPNSSYTLTVTKVTTGQDTENRYTLTVSAVPVTLRVAIYDTPVTNVRFVPASKEATYASSSVFSDAFLARMRGSSGSSSGTRAFNLLRVCEMGNEDYGVLSYWPTVINQWVNRTVPADSTQVDTQYGVALEYLVALANLLSADLWVCTARQGDAQWDTNYATYIRDNLDQSRKVYVQYSNRVGLNTQQAPGLRGIIQKYTDIFGADRRVSQLVFVAEVQRYDYYDHVDTMFGRNFTGVDAISVAGRFGALLNWDQNYLDVQSLAGYTVDDVFRDLQSNLYDTLIKDIDDIQRARARGLPVIAFGAGPYLRAPQYGWRDRLSQAVRSGAARNTTLENLAALEQTFSDVLVAANRDARVKQLMLDYLRRWRKLGGKAIVAQVLVASVLPASHGHDALLETLTDASSPKFDAFFGFLNGETTTLPLTAADIPPVGPPPQACTPQCVWGTCYNGQCDCYRGYSGAACDVYDEASKPNACNDFVGVNPGGIADWSSEWPFVDVFKNSRQWITQKFGQSPWDTGLLNTVPLDDNGYPTSLPPNVKVGTMMLRDLQGHYEAGVYVVLYDGDGVLQFSMDDVKGVRRVRPGRVELNITPTTGLNNGIFMTIWWTNPDDPVRNVRIIRPGFESTYQYYPFHPQFLHNLERFRTLRFMDWLQTNSDQYVSWANRTREGANRTYTIGSVPIETCVRLCNTLGANMWLNIPHRADDAYAQALAEYVFATLEPHLTVYVEYSNEVWGTLFAGGSYSQLRGQALSLNTDPNDARFCFVHLRSAQIFSVFATAATAANARSRLVTVIASQSVNADVTRRILGCRHPLVTGARLFDYLDAVAVAPYFSAATYTNSTRLVLEDIDYMMTVKLPAGVQSALNDTRNQIALLAANTTYASLKVLLYEAGQGLVDTGDANGTALAIACNLDARMQGLYTTYLNGLKALGVSLINLFSSVGLQSVYGSWGFLTAQDSRPSGSPKYLAIVAFLAANATFDGRAQCVNANTATVTYSGCPNACTTTGSNAEGNGVCMRGARCGCYFGWQGADCSTPRFVDYVQCGYKCTFDQGVCVLQAVQNGFQRYYGCACNAGWTGLVCSVPFCATNCTNFRGQCVGPDRCQCFAGYWGARCENDCGCDGHGSGCDPATGNTTCLCDAGFRFNATLARCEYACTCRNPDLQTCIAPGECSCIWPCTNGYCANGTCACYPGWGGRQCDTRVSNAPNADSPLGVNIAGASAWAPQQPFLNIFKTAFEWIPQRVLGYFPGELQYVWNTREPLAVDADGWVTSLAYGQAAGTLLLRDVQQRVANGLFVVLYDGNGVLRVGMDAKVVWERKGRILINVTLTTVRDNGIFLQITATDANNPLRNIRVVRAEFEYTFERQRFDADFVQNSQRYKAVRFMSWQAMNTPPTRYKLPQTEWANRTRVTAATYSQADYGVAIEEMVLLSNILSSDAWFCIPERASDDYVTKFATLLRETLRSDLKVYVEYGNEMWASNHGGYWWLSLNDADDADTQNAYQWYAKRSVQIFDIFERVFGSRDRLRFVLSTQTVNTWVTRQILTYNNSYLRADALGVAGYFTCDGLSAPENATRVTLWTLDQIFTRCNNSVARDMQPVSDQLQVVRASQFALPGNRSLELAFYEFGPSILEQSVIYSGTDTPGVTARFAAIHRDARMQGVYYNVLQYVLQMGAFQTMPPFHFVDVAPCSKYGCWGAKEYPAQRDADAPKFLALWQFVTQVSGVTFQRKGCTDATALNYDAKAVTNDNSCKYAPTVISAASGGTIAVQGTRATVQFEPAYASTDLAITVTDCAHPNNASLGAQFDFGPYGTQFDVPVTVCLQANADVLADPAIVSTLTLCYSQDELTWDCLDPATVQVVGTQLCGSVSHFTIFSVFRQSNLPKDELPPSQVISNGGGTTDPGTGGGGGTTDPGTGGGGGDSGGGTTDPGTGGGDSGGGGTTDPGTGGGGGDSGGGGTTDPGTGGGGGDSGGGGTTDPGTGGDGTDNSDGNDGDGSNTVDASNPQEQTTVFSPMLRPFAVILVATLAVLLVAC